MADESYSFTAARARLEEIVVQVRKKDTSLEKSLDLLEEGVRLANSCTELIDHADWTVGPAAGDDADAADAVSEAQSGVESDAAIEVADAGEAALGDADEGPAPADAAPVDEQSRTVPDAGPGDGPTADDDSVAAAVFDASGEFDEADGAWAEDETPADEPGFEDDPAADEG